ncbi:MAG: ThuA domain-containing protein [Fimbriimonadaceae bacterium]|nr:ThuA domain-containing protein [Fimbriimonadaceae bacterium]
MVAALLATVLAPPIEVLVFSRTAAFRHDAIPAAVEAVRSLDPATIRVVATEDPSSFTGARLSHCDVVVFLLTTGDVLDDRQQAAMEGFIEAGGGFVGVHSASDTEYEWAWYGNLVGAYFLSHPAVQEAGVVIEDASHPTVSHLPTAWTRTDEWYDFRSQPRRGVHVLASVDEATYQGGKMAGDHPVVWWKEVGKGRSWYTAMGHTKESYSEPLFMEMLRKAVLWAARKG